MSSPDTPNTLRPFQTLFLSVCCLFFYHFPSVSTVVVLLNTRPNLKASLTWPCGGGWRKDAVLWMQCFSRNRKHLSVVKGQLPSLTGTQKCIHICVSWLDPHIHIFIGTRTYLRQCLKTGQTIWRIRGPSRKFRAMPPILSSRTVPPRGVISQNTACTSRTANMIMCHCLLLRMAFSPMDSWLAD